MTIHVSVSLCCKSSSLNWIHSISMLDVLSFQCHDTHCLRTQLEYIKTTTNWRQNWSIMTLLFWFIKSIFIAVNLGYGAPPPKYFDRGHSRLQLMWLSFKTPLYSIVRHLSYGRSTITTARGIFRGRVELAPVPPFGGAKKLCTIF